MNDPVSILCYHTYTTATAKTFVSVHPNLWFTKNFNKMFQGIKICNKIFFGKFNNNKGINGDGTFHTGLQNLFFYDIFLVHSCDTEWHQTSRTVLHYITLHYVTLTKVIKREIPIF
jgi:hypothetical protein